MGTFEKYLSLWVALCIMAGIGLGYVAGDGMQAIGNMKIGEVNIPVAVLVWLMIYPMMVQIDFSALGRVAGNWRGLGLTLTVNWLIKPFTMALFAGAFFYYFFAGWIGEKEANEYFAGAVLLGAAPCTAMVFIWSYLVRGDANYTLVQVAVNDLVLLVAFVPIVGLLLGVAAVPIEYTTLFASVVIFVVIPLAAGYISRVLLLRMKGEEWFKNVFLVALKPLSIVALLATLVLLFAFQGGKILSNPWAIALIAVPLTLQTYFIFFASWGIGRMLKLPHRVCAPAAMIGASNFFELSVAVAIIMYGMESGASLATVVGVLIEVPVMLSLVALANRWRYE